MADKLHKDILGQEIKQNDFIVYTSPQAGLRVGMVVDPIADGWSGTYTYIHRKVKAVTLDYRDVSKTQARTSTPTVTMIMVVNDLPEEFKEALIEQARVLGYGK